MKGHNILDPNDGSVVVSVVSKKQADEDGDDEVDDSSTFEDAKGVSSANLVATELSTDLPHPSDTNVPLPPSSDVS